jgi:hypothetical protein
MAKAKYQAVGDYTIRHGKSPNDPESERAWRDYDGDEPHEYSDEHEEEEEAVSQAEELWCEHLKEEITGSLPDDMETLTAILKLINEDQ